ncbi:amidophosphoribosyltransferase [uncultured Methanospirillum sp.]|uniref:amidophosphoribosyltransferase n=1 Tax=uncultured Methanospirillum sp. TaxID=262503 RepID=UPI0029C78D55|nr:amidophosphoribosyltransferase [uncultured Methanospirillum sp.]
MCGIVGISNCADVSFSLYYALYALQHRGQESAGIATFNGSGLCKFKGNGLVSEVFSETTLSSLSGSVGIGHVRYPTTGENRPENIQPFLFSFRGHVIAIAHNGNLVNYRDLRTKFEDKGQIFWSTSDTEIISKIITEEIRKGGTIEDAVRKCMECLKGSYSVVLMYDGDLYAFRDPHGIRPLCFGKAGDSYVICSESVAIDALAGTLERDVYPGEMIHISQDGVRSKQIAEARHRGHCVFEYIYFARADSRLDGSLVYDVRRKIGAQISDDEPVKADVVCPVPDSGTAYAVGFSEHSGIPFKECLIKNRYMGRTFIMPTQKKREQAVRIKLNPIPDHLNDRSVVLVDDSIVRGTTSRRIIETMRDAGAREIHMRIGSPIIKAPCYLGVDMPTRTELIGSDKDVEEVRRSITATSLHYLSVSALVDAVGIPQEDLCLGCLTGCYPVEISNEVCDNRCVTIVDRDFQTNLFHH